MIQKSDFESINGDSQTDEALTQSEAFLELESQIESIRDSNRQQSETFEERFDQLDQRLTRLTDQVSDLVTATSDTAIPAGDTPSNPQPTLTTVRTTEPTVATENTSESPPSFSGEPKSQSLPNEKLAAEWAQIETPTTASGLASLTSSIVSESITAETDDVADDEPVNDGTVNESIVNSPTQVAEPEPTNPAADADQTEPQANESVADLLARMKAEGQWEGLEDENDTPSGSFSKSEPPSISSPPPTPQPVETPAPAKSEEGDVDSYMAQLLARMRGGDDNSAKETPAKPTPQSAVATAPRPASSPTAATPTPSKPSVEHPDLMTEEEYKPLKKATKIQSFDAMRELANSTARTAVASSEESRRKALAYVQLGISVASLAMAGYYFGVASKAIGDTSFIIGVILIVVTSFLAYRFHKTMSNKPSFETETK